MTISNSVLIYSETRVGEGGGVMYLHAKRYMYHKLNFEDVGAASRTRFSLFGIYFVNISCEFK